MKGSRGAVRAKESGAVRESSAFLRSSKEITVCGCKKVLHYAPDSVRLMLSDGIMEINGEGLTASTYFGREIRLSGRINAVRLLETQNEGIGER